MMKGKGEKTEPNEPNRNNQKPSRTESFERNRTQQSFERNRTEIFGKKIQNNFRELGRTQEFFWVFLGQQLQVSESGYNDSTTREPFDRKSL